MMDTTMQIIVSVLASLVIAFGLDFIILPLLRRLKFGQMIRAEGPKSHQSKSGTPTMGGVIFLLAFVITGLFFALRYSSYCRTILPVMLLTIGFALIGLIDDMIKVVAKRNLGLTEIQKMALQILVTGGFAAYMVMQQSGTTIAVPFTDISLVLPAWAYVVFIFVVVIGTVNGSNFTDGLDGLASSVTVVIAGFFMFAAYAVNEMGLVTLSGAMLGGLLGFLIINVYPAKVFMGDTGSLALGGFVAGMACMLHNPLIIILVAFIYLIEVISVMLQVTYFKITKKKYGEGKRIFRMAPLHHHFQEGGQSETQVVTRFAIVTVVLCMIAYIGL